MSKRRLHHAFLRIQPMILDTVFPIVTPGDYRACYDPLYLLIKMRQMDFATVASALGLPERRIRDVLINRLGTGEKSRLADAQSGWCYLCLTRVEVEREPLCFACLRKICRVVLKEEDIAAPEHYGFERPRT
jgi:hypothetical protein